MEKPRKYKYESFPSGVTNFCYRKIPLRTSGFALGLETPKTKTERYQRWSLTSI
jgi:hypothetical protein